MTRYFKKLITRFEIEQPRVHLWRAIVFGACAALILFAAFIFAYDPKVISVTAEQSVADAQFDFNAADNANDYVLARADSEGNTHVLAEAYEPGNVIELARADSEGNTHVLAEAYEPGNVIELARAGGEGNTHELANVGYTDLLAAY